ncbi:MAG: DinB family protein [Saprospiraceae bacterium]
MILLTFYKEIDEISQDFNQEFGHLSTAQLNWKINPSTWSIAQNINHLIVINQSYFSTVEQLKNGSYRLPLHGRIPLVTSLFGKMILDAVSPDRRKKMKTFPIWEPQQSDFSNDIITSFLNHQETLKNTIKFCSILMKQKVAISSPANKCIVYKLETAFQIMISHEKRHLEQAREVKTRMFTSLADQ